MTMPWTPAERAEMAAEDAEIEATFRLTAEEVDASEWRDLLAVCDRAGKDPETERARRERKRAFNRAHYAKHRERELEKARRKYEADPEAVRAKRRKWYAENRERVRARQRAYEAEHQEEIRVRKRKHYAENRDRIQAQQKIYRNRKKAEREEQQP